MSNGAFNFGDLFKSNDGITIASQGAAELIGKELSAEGLRAATAVHLYGCADILAVVMRMKKQQGGLGDYLKLVKGLSKQQAWEEMTEFQGKIDKKIQKAAG